MKREIWRHCPVTEQVAWAERLLQREVLADRAGAVARHRQPGRCRAIGCEVPPPAATLDPPSE